MKKLPFDLPKLESIVKDYPTPFHIYDERGITNCVKSLQQAFSWNKGFKEYFAVKALPNPYILALLKKLGCGTDCASSVELTLSEASGIIGGDIMFSSNDTQGSEFAQAKRLGAIINLDEITHIKTLEDSCGIPETICLRYNPGSAFAMTNAIMGNLSDSKFGMTKPQLFEAVRILKDKGVKRFGIHAMLLSAELDNAYYPALAANLFRLAVEIKEACGVSLSFVNLSGGIGIPYRPDQQPIDIMAVGMGVKAAYDEILVPAGLELDIYSELGRYITGPYGYLVSTVLHEKNIYKNYIGLDACCANLMRPAMYGAYHHITVMGKENAPSDHMYDVTGSLCENNDKFAIDRMLPETSPGDLVVIHDTGAHGHSMGFNYNGKLRSAELMLCSDGSVKLIRRAETVADYFATLDFSPFFK